MIQVVKSLCSRGSRHFSTKVGVIPSITELTDKFTQQSMDLYKQNKVDVDKELDKVRVTDGFIHNLSQ
jgi:hypothetical protein